MYGKNSSTLKFASNFLSLFFWGTTFCHSSSHGHHVHVEGRQDSGSFIQLVLVAGNRNCKDILDLFKKGQWPVGGNSDLCVRFTQSPLTGENVGYPQPATASLLFRIFMGLFGCSHVGSLARIYGPGSPHPG
jgi:hypothetical protein